MTFDVEFADAARNDLFEILEFITTDSPRRGATFVDELEAFIRKRLAIFPDSGTRIGEYRFVVFHNYVAVYAVDEHMRRVRVVLVTEGHRKWRSVFE